MQYRKAFTLVELIVAIVITCLLMAMLWPGIQAAKEAARRPTCVNNLKQIGIALHNYHNVLGSLPPAFVINEDKHPLYSWRINILPYIEQQKLYDLFRLDEAWDGEHNITLFEQQSPMYVCPQQYRFERRDCPYGMIVGPDTVSNGPQAVKFSEITDGLSNTIFVAETRKPIPWSSPTDISFASLAMGVLKGDDPRAAKDGIASRHREEETVVLVGDGAVRLLSPKIEPKVLQALATISGGEKIDW